ncbi:hypothetical protein PSV08DRAFT_375482 [Bipolaris maydis]|uniref:uncharacterized protein n=1 Tax=Cochliobolus heterostrophus TaxID=5016 RepID=UPI0024D883A1|nr:hypothetical protein PSV08DRAFT_375482 [Bipolaris maydis]
MPFLPHGIYNILTPLAIEQQSQRRGGHPCSGLFEKTNGLLCRYTLGALRRNEASTRRDPSAFERPQVSTLVTVSVPTSILGAGPVTTCILVSVPAPAPLPSLTSPRSSPPVAVAVLVTMAPSPVWRPPTPEEFLADIKTTNFLARNMALATQGLFTSCILTMAWNYYFGDMEAFYTKRFA